MKPTSQSCRSSSAITNGFCTVDSTDVAVASSPSTWKQYNAPPAPPSPTHTRPPADAMPVGVSRALDFAPEKVALEGADAEKVRPARRRA